MLQITEISKRWYALPDDPIGGWSITTNERTLSDSGQVIVEFLTQEIAEHIVTLHNNWLLEVSR